MWSAQNVRVRVRKHGRSVASAGVAASAELQICWPLVRTLRGEGVANLRAYTLNRENLGRSLLCYVAS